MFFNSITDNVALLHCARHQMSGQCRIIAPMQTCGSVLAFTVLPPEIEMQSGIFSEYRHSTPALFMASRSNISVSHITSVDSRLSPSHSQSVGELAVTGSFNTVSVPSSDSGSRSTSGDTGEGELRSGSIEV